VTRYKGAPIPAEEKLAHESTRSAVDDLVLLRAAALYLSPVEAISKGNEPALASPLSIERCYILPPVVNLALEEGLTTIHFHVHPRVPVPRFDPESPLTLVQLDYAGSIASSSAGRPVARTSTMESLGTFTISADTTWRGGVHARDAMAVDDIVKALSAFHDVDSF
jgi:hypothetical protein